MLSDYTETEVKREDDGITVCRKWLPLKHKGLSNYVANCTSVYYDNGRWYYEEKEIRDGWGGTGTVTIKLQEIDEERAKELMEELSTKK